MNFYEEARPKRQESQQEEEELEGNQRITLERCLSDFKEPQLLDDDNKWFCWRCKTHVQATKVMQIYRAPPCLVVSLKRFKTQKKKLSAYSCSYNSAEVAGKKDTPVEFPIEGLDLSQHVMRFKQEQS